MKLNLFTVLLSLIVSSLYGQEYKTQFVQMEDGVKLAVDIYFPEEYKDVDLLQAISFVFSPTAVREIQM